MHEINVYAEFEQLSYSKLRFTKYHMQYRGKRSETWKGSKEIKSEQAALGCYHFEITNNENSYK